MCPSAPQGMQRTWWPEAGTIIVTGPYLGPAHIQDPDWVITVPADGLAPDGARPSAGTVMTTEFDMFCFFALWRMFCRSDFFLKTNGELSQDNVAAFHYGWKLSTFIASYKAQDFAISDKEFLFSFEVA